MLCVRQTTQTKEFQMAHPIVSFDTVKGIAGYKECKPSQPAVLALANLLLHFKQYVSTVISFCFDAKHSRL